MDLTYVSLCIKDHFSRKSLANMVFKGIVRPENASSVQINERGLLIFRKGESSLRSLAIDHISIQMYPLADLFLMVNSFVLCRLDSLSPTKECHMLIQKKKKFSSRFVKENEPTESTHAGLWNRW